MTVEKLIKLLRLENPEAEVILRNDEMGCNFAVALVAPKTEYQELTDDYKIVIKHGTYVEID